MPEEKENFERCNATAFVGASSSLFSFFLSLFRCRGHLIDLEIFSFFYLFCCAAAARFVRHHPPTIIINLSDGAGRPSVRSSCGILCEGLLHAMVA